MSWPEECRPDVLVVDGSRLLRDGLVSLLTGTDGLGTVRGAPDLEGIGTDDPLLPDVVVLSWASPACLRLLEQLTVHVPGCAAIVIGLDENEAAILPCVEAGAAGYLPLEASREQLVALVHSVVSGGTQAAPAIIRALMRRVGVLAAQTRREPLGLTSREHEVLALVAAGLSNLDIAARLGVEVRTVKNHLHNVFGKLGVSTRAEAVAAVRGWRTVPSVLRD